MLGSEWRPTTLGTRPERTPDPMIKLGKTRVLDTDTARTMADTARFRTGLALTVGDAIDNDQICEALQDHDRYPDFIVAIRTDLRRIAALD